MRKVVASLAVGIVLMAVPLGLAPASAGGSFVDLDPDPAYPGAVVTVTVVGGWPECNNPSDAASFIRLDTGSGIVEGAFPGGTNTGTLVIPDDLAQGSYNVAVQCTFSLGNSVYYPTNPIQIGPVPSTTTTADTSSSTGATTGDRDRNDGSGRTPASAPAAAVGAQPAYTG